MLCATFRDVKMIYKKFVIDQDYINEILDECHQKHGRFLTDIIRHMVIPDQNKRPYID